VNFPGRETLIDTFVNVRVTGVSSHTLRGELLNAQ
jgi:hypothetical protein